MCGIVGIFNNEKAPRLVKKALAVIKHRGQYLNFLNGEKFCIGHVFHSAKHLTAGKGILLIDCDRNKELKNKIEAVFNLLGVSMEVIGSLDGAYALSYLCNDKLYLVRDILGIKPLWYCHADGFSFSSEKKALENIGLMNISELDPRKILAYDLKNDRIEFIERNFFSTTPEVKGYIEKNVEQLLTDAIRKRISGRKLGILFSGGIDSTMLAFIAKKLGKDFTCYTAVLDDPKLKTAEDLIYAEKVARHYGFKLKIRKLKLNQIEKYLKRIVPLIEDPNVVKAGVALPLYLACEMAKNDGCEVVFSGLGSEEIFAGYQRHKDSDDINSECLSGLLKMHERDLYRDEVITMSCNLELQTPFLDKNLVEYCLKIPSRYKISQGIEKYILRLVALALGIEKEFAMRKKKAAQYGSNLHKAIEKLAKKNKFERKYQYLNQFYRNIKLGALVSSGKDSVYAMHVMIKQKYNINCMITLKSKNPDSYMFHTPTVDLVRLQSESMRIPLLIHETEGEEEKELDDLKKALQSAKEKFQLDGIVTGALYSKYQKERIEKICKSLSLKVFSPLWHMNEETYMNELIDNGFEFILTKVAAEGLDSSWLGRIITKKDIEKLIEIKKRVGINLAFEGGEAETLVLNCPIFKKRLEINFDIEEDKNTANLKIKSANLATSS